MVLGEWINDSEVYFSNIWWKTSCTNEICLLPFPVSYSSQLWPILFSLPGLAYIFLAWFPLPSWWDLALTLPSTPSPSFQQSHARVSSCLCNCIMCELPLPWQHEGFGRCVSLHEGGCIPHLSSSAFWTDRQFDALWLIFVSYWNSFNLPSYFPPSILSHSGEPCCTTQGTQRPESPHLKKHQTCII